MQIPAEFSINLFLPLPYAMTCFYNYEAYKLFGPSIQFLTLSLAR